MKLNKVWIFIFETTWKSYYKTNLKKIPGNLLKKNLEKSWKYHGILSVWKSGNPVYKITICTKLEGLPVEVTSWKNSIKQRVMPVEN